MMGSWTAGPAQRRFSLTWAALLAFVVVVSVVSLRAWGLSRDGQDWRMMDFRNQIYYPATAFREGFDPYDAGAYRERYPATRRFAPYLPHTLLLHLPWSVLPVGTAEATYFAWTLLLYVAIAALALAAAGLPITTASLFGLATLVLASRPGHNNLLLGQLGAELAAATLGALHFARSRPRLSALCLAAALVKPTYGGPLAVMMLVRRDVGVVARAALLTALASGVVVAVLAWNAGGLGVFLHTLYAGGTRYGQMLGLPQDLISRSDVAILIGRLLWVRIDWPMQVVIAAVVVAVACLALARIRRASGGVQRTLSTGVICLALVLCSYHQAYDLLVLVALPVSLLVAEDESAAMGSISRWAMVLLVTFPFVNYIASYHAVAFFGLEGTPVRIIGLLNAASLSAAFVLYLRAAFRMPVCVSGGAMASTHVSTSEK